MTTVLIGPGYTGSRVASRLDESIVFGRSLPGDRHLDLDGDGPSLIGLPAQYSLIYPVPPVADEPDDPRLARLLDRLPHDPLRVVYLSTTGVYGDRGGAVVDETVAVNPGSGRSQRRVEAENLLLAWCSTRATVPVILRVPGIYGPGRIGLDRIAAGAPVIAEEDASPGNRIHVDDLAGCCIATLSPDVPGGIYNVGDGDSRSSTWFTFEVARQAGLPPPPCVSREEAEKTFSPMRLSFLRESRVVDVTKMRETLGYHPTFSDPADGIAASLADDPLYRAGSGDVSRGSKAQRSEP
jgi:nucleoside-diphosphate-sugar epimerase